MSSRAPTGSSICPGAGRDGGAGKPEGPPAALVKAKDSLTGQFFAARRR